MPGCERKGGSIQILQDVFLLSAASVVGTKEGRGPLGKLFDLVGEDDLFGESTWEMAEGAIQKEACHLALQKAGVHKEQVDLLLGGDLLRQSMPTNMNGKDLGVPLLGLYGACATVGAALALGAIGVVSGGARYVLGVTSSHFASVEKEFRFPLGYAGQRPLSAHWTVTGGGAFLLGDKTGKVQITGVTIGRVTDYGLKDSQNMGACMAPAAVDTIVRHLHDFQREPADYDRIITGDLGVVGREILLDLLEKRGLDIQRQHMDCGILIFEKTTQDAHAGGSGCGCAAVILAAYIFPMLAKGEWKRVLFVPTGALMSTVSFNEGLSVPGIAHGIVLERR